VRWNCLWIEEKGRVLLWKRGDNDRLLKNLWGLPESGRVPADVGHRLTTLSHSITHHALTVELHAAALQGRPILPDVAKWVPRPKLKDYLVSSLWLKLLSASKKRATTGTR
jgi:hypothetical protein